MTPTKRDVEKAREIIDSYCPDGIVGPAMINGKMLAEDIAQALAEERERCCAIVFGQCSSDNVAQRTVNAIRGQADE